MKAVVDVGIIGDEHHVPQRPHCFLQLFQGGAGQVPKHLVLETVLEIVVEFFGEEVGVDGFYPKII